MLLIVPSKFSKCYLILQTYTSVDSEELLRLLLSLESFKDVVVVQAKNSHYQIAFW